jgi:hypothetical protein
MDPGTGLTILGSAIGSKTIFEKLLGPTAELFGERLKDWTAKRIANANRVVEKAVIKVGDQIQEAGAVPPKVLKELLNEASFSDDELTAEYFAGVLASSRSGISRDDRGATYMKLVAGLSSYEVRLHYILYSLWRSMFSGSGLRLTYHDDFEKMWIFVSYRELFKSMDMVAEEPWNEIFLHCITSLSRQDLLGHSHYGEARCMRRRRIDQRADFGVTHAARTLCRASPCSEVTRLWSPQYRRR